MSSLRVVLVNRVERARRMPRMAAGAALLASLAAALSSAPMSTSTTLATAAVVAAAAGCPNVGTECGCSSCGSAVTLNVVDQDGNAVSDDWIVDASLNGAEIDTSSCTPAARGGLNACSFGFDTGVYTVVVLTPNEAQELAVRFAAGASDDCCNTCLAGASAVVTLQEPL